MPIVTRLFTELILAIFLLVLLADGVVIVATIARRRRRNLRFRRVDALRQQYGPVLAALLAENIPYSRGLALLRSIPQTDREPALEQLLMEHRPTPAQVPMLRQICEDVGLIGAWQRHLMGNFDAMSFRDALSRPEGIVQRVNRLSFVLRAKAAENLGRIRHEASWPLLVKALDDPHVDVRSAALRALGALSAPESFASLVKRLDVLVLDSSAQISLSSIEAALANFPLVHARELLASLEHCHPRVRLLATDVICEMVERQAAIDKALVLETPLFAPEMAEFLICRLYSEENPDVRGRAASIIAHLSDPRATRVLLTLLHDREWFVRLRAVRALARPKYVSEAFHIGDRLTDSHWMVREAAVRSLFAFGEAGIEQLAAHFLGSDDQYSREQIADEMQRAGFIPSLLERYAQRADGTDLKIIDQLTRMGKTSTMVALLESSSDRNLRKQFVQDFGRRRDPGIQAWVRRLAAQERDSELRALAQAAIVAPA